MIYVTGDIHGEIDIGKLSYKNWRESRDLTENDYLIIMGDFGLPFLDSDVDENNQPADGEYRYWIKWLSKKPYTILWVDGNHENFNYWDRQEISEWHGGKVQIHPHAPNIIHLMRGEIYEIDGMSFFAFGGAGSHDKEYRKPNITWWEQEEATESEILNARRNLSKYNNCVDFILTHTMPSEISRQAFDRKSTDKTACFLDKVISDVNYNMWFCGHYHRTAFIRNANIFVLYNGIYSLEKCREIQKG
ncbi:MAG: metallophosphoesterase [Ruminococcus sp.]|nr:metallophosphoesterase [Ruminococcus sp.]